MEPQGRLAEFGLQLENLTRQSIQLDTALWTGVLRFPRNFKSAGRQPVCYVSTLRRDFFVEQSMRDDEMFGNPLCIVASDRELIGAFEQKRIGHHVERDSKGNDGQKPPHQSQSGEYSQTGLTSEDNM